MIETNDYLPQIHSSHFLSGVVEGFYGKPWTTNQRKKLFARMKEFGMNTYLYAPKDDSKHRAYWRILYTTEEGNVLKELIEACNNNSIKFVYAISPGLDITYSNESDVNKLKQKLEQVQQFGCKYFSILFDDIDYEMQPEDKLMFKTFAQAQTYITNLLYKHLNEPELFIFCPTEYCIDMIKSKVLDENNEYLNTIGNDLLPNIKIMWTGPRVVSPFITIKHMKIVIKLFKRLPLIWDNYHANDYDLKRVFMGPYSSRSINLMNYISGVLTNPNCEFESNYIPIYTLAVWSHLKPKQQEQEQLTTIDNTDDATKTPNFSCFCLDQTYGSQYEFDEFEEIEQMKESDSFSINYYMNYDEAKYKRIIDNIDENIDITTSIMIDKLNTNESINEYFINNNYLTDCLLNLAIKKWLPVLNENECEQQIYQLNDVIDCDNDCSIDSSSLNNDDESTKHLSKLNSSTKHKAQLDACNSLLSKTANNQENENAKIKSVDNSMTAIPSTAGQQQQQQQQLNEYDLKILIDIFYLPFDFGDYSIYLFKELEHLKQEALQLANNNQSSIDQKINEWIIKYKRYVKVVNRINQIVLKSTNMLNKQLLIEFFQRLFDINCLLNVTVAFLDWLHKHCILLDNGDNSTFFLNLTKYLSNSDPLSLNDNLNQPWVKYRGGLYAQLVNVLSFKTIHFPLYFEKQLIRPNYQLVNNLLNSYKIRNYESNDYENICKLFVGNKLQQASSYVINSDSLAIGAYLNYSSKHCYLIEDQLNKQIVAVFLTALNVKEFYEICLVNWIPKMCDKYPDDNCNDGDYHRKFINFHKSLPFLLPYDDSICSKYVSVGVLKINMMDSIIDKTIQLYLLRQLLSIGLLCLKSQGSIGIYTHLNDTIDQYKEEKMLEKFGFLKLISSNNNNYNNNNNTNDVSNSNSVSSSSSSIDQQNQQHYDVPIYALAI